MFKKILFPTDFSDCSEKVIPFILKMKESGTSEVVVLNVIDIRYCGLVETISWSENTMQPFEAELFVRMKENAVKKLDAIKKKLSKRFRVRILVREGIPIKTILDVADKERVSLIILGSHGKSNIEEMLIGSVSEKVIRKSRQPCLVIKRGQ